MGNRKIKRKRGGQKGNLNARKHGFYASVLTPAEICEFWNTINLEGIDPEIAVLRIRLRSLLDYDPGNRRAINEAARSLSRWYGMKYRLEQEYVRIVKKTVLTILEQYTASAPSSLDNLDEKNKQF